MDRTALYGIVRYCIVLYGMIMEGNGMVMQCNAISCIVMYACDFGGVCIHVSIYDIHTWTYLRTGMYGTYTDCDSSSSLNFFANKASNI